MREPKSIEDIVKDASNFDHKTHYPLRIALRTAQNMLNQAANYERDANLEAAYLFYYRHAEFYFSQIAKHADARLPRFKSDVARVRDDVSQDIVRLETLKPELKARYDKYWDSVRKRDAAKAKLLEEEREKNKTTTTTTTTTTTELQDQEPNLYQNSLVLNAGQHNHLALQLANRESRRTGPTDGDGDMDSLSQGIRAIGRQLDGSHPTRLDKAAMPRNPRYNYPTVPHQSRSTLSPALPPKSTVERPSPPPSVPSKQPFPPPTSPAVPSKSPLEASSVPSISSLPNDNKDFSASDYTFSSTATTEAGLPLRTIFLPAELRAAFLSIARKNTTANLETCAVLAATLISNAFFITRLIVPDQVSTSDTCEVTEAGDVALFDYVDGAALTVCGWIHTHPSQTCFLSSRDLHTTVGYQVMLPESVAIVCAPSKSPDHGIFRLTDPTGKDAILSCHQPGIFHPHAQSNLYTDALRPGHVCELEGLQFQVLDLRSQK